MKQLKQHALVFGFIFLAVMLALNAAKTAPRSHISLKDVRGADIGTFLKSDGPIDLTVEGLSLARVKEVFVLASEQSTIVQTAIAIAVGIVTNALYAGLVLLFARFDFRQKFP
jgi:hypothetical protein